VTRYISLAKFVWLSAGASDLIGPLAEEAANVAGGSLHRLYLGPTIGQRRDPPPTPTHRFEHVRPVVDDLQTLGHSEK